jgi:hypothetical protein
MTRKKNSAAEENRMVEEAGYEYLIGMAAAAQREDNRNQLDQMEAELDELRDAKRNENIWQKAHGFIPNEDE